MSGRGRFALQPEDVPILLTACALPWAFGGASLWATRLAGLGLVTGTALALSLRGRAGVAAPRGWLLPAALLGAFALLQVVPMPPAVLNVLSPGAARVYGETFPGWPASGEALPALEQAARERVPESAPAPAEGADRRLEASPPVPWRSWRPLSLAPSLTLEAAFWYFALLAASLTVVRRFQDRAARAAYRDVLFALFALLAVFGLAQGATWNGKIYWVSLQPGRPFGPYLNGTHFAGVMEIASPWIAGYLAGRLRRDGAAALRSPRGLAAGAGLAACVAAGIAAQSKLGAVLVAISVTVVAVGAARPGRARFAVFAAAAAAWAAGAVVLASSPLGERFRSQLAESGGSLDRDRLAAWSACLPMGRDFPWFGSGLGAFRDVFPRYLPAGEIQGWQQAHNDWLEVALGGGLVGSVLVLALVVTFARQALRALRALDQRGERSERRGLLVGLAALAAHAFFDFNHQIPANALLFTLAASMAAAPVARHLQGRAM